MTRTVLITGAASGIGRALARRLRTADYRVIGWDSQPDEHCDPVPLDVTDWDAVERRAADLDETLDAVVTCAGTGLRGPVDIRSAEAFDRTIRVNVTGTANVAAALHTRLVGGGTLVTVGSVAASVPMADRAAYCASKAAVVMLSRCLASEWASDGIQVVCVSPGFVNEGMAVASTSTGATSLDSVVRRTPTGRLVPVEGLLDVFESLVAGSMRSIHGTELVVDEGFTSGWRLS